MSLCLWAGSSVTALGASAFTLIWTHSIEKSAWQEDWRLTGAGLVIEEARVTSTGAGMEPPAGAVLAGGVWHYRPALPPLAELVLATSAATAPWRLCPSGRACLTIPASPDAAPARIARCPDSNALRGK
ncbi:MAG: DUF1850 domain-containing protein [Hyphomicrobiaceae bacterium]|nr:DUF1850 domain-containing protein [Hyphomicrobiaceae bacterium]